MYFTVKTTIPSVSRDTELHRSTLSWSICAIGLIFALQGFVELTFYDLIKWPSYVGLGIGLAMLLFAIVMIPKLKTRQATHAVFLVGIPTLVFRVWTLNGAAGATVAWFSIGPMLAVMYLSRRELFFWSGVCLVTYILTMFICHKYPFIYYADYPAALGYLLTSYVLFIIPFHMFLLKKLDTALQDEVQRQRLHSQHSAKLAAVGRLAGNLAHELNTPFNTVLFLNNKLRTLIGDDMSPEMLHVFERQSQIIKSTSGIIGALLKSTELTANKGSAVIHPNSVMNEINGLLGGRLRFARVRLESHVEKADDIRPLQTSQGGLMQVILILISNAVDALEVNKEIADKWINVLFKYSDDAIAIHIVDAGPGIPAEIRETMFYPPATVDGSTAGSLYLALEIIRDLGGNIEYESTSENTHFKVTLPLGETIAPHLKKVANG